MKKMLKRIMVLVVAATLFAMPATSVLAASAPVPIIITERSTVYEFQPEPFYMSGGGNEGLFLDTYTGSQGAWIVPAGKRFNFQITTKEANTTVIMTIYKNGVQVSEYVTSSTIYGYLFNIAPESSNNTWRFKITPLSPATIRLYAGTVNEP